jgi:hypothetical protein
MRCVSSTSVQALLHELRAQQRYVMPPAEQEGAPCGEEEEEAVEDGQQQEEAAGAAAASAQPEAQHVAAPADAPRCDSAAAAATPAVEPPPPLTGDPAQYADGALARAALARCRIVLLTGDADKALLSRAQLAGAMHAITVGTAHTKLLAQGLERLAAPDALLAVEVRAQRGRAACVHVHTHTRTL